MSGRVVLGNSSVAGYPQAGGHSWVFLQYLLGLKGLGHDPFWLELLTSTGEHERDVALVSKFFERLRRYDAERDAAVVVLPGDRLRDPALETASCYGRTAGEITRIIRDADLLWNFAGAVQGSLLGLFRRRVFVDLDPGHLQVSALTWDLGLVDHHVFLNVGGDLHAADSQVPTLGYTWHPFVPFVYLPLWPVAEDPGPDAPITSITHWTWAELWWEQRVLSISKRDGYLRYLDLPLRSRAHFELAAGISAGDPTGDRPLLERNGWRVVDPYQVTGDPDRYREYITASRAEISCPKPLFRELRTGWFSDRSVCYLATGRPVLAEDTGFTRYLPAGEGLLAFGDPEGAVRCVDELNGDYERHRLAAREIAESHFDSAKCLDAMLTVCA
jgi:hypothetical protein